MRDVSFAVSLLPVLLISRLLRRIRRPRHNMLFLRIPRLHCLIPPLHLGLLPSDHRLVRPKLRRRRLLTLRTLRRIIPQVEGVLSLKH